MRDVCAELLNREKVALILRIEGLRNAALDVSSGVLTLTAEADPCFVSADFGCSFSIVGVGLSVTLDVLPSTALTGALLSISIPVTLGLLSPTALAAFASALARIAA